MQQPAVFKICFIKTEGRLGEMRTLGLFKLNV